MGVRELIHVEVGRQRFRPSVLRRKQFENVWSALEEACDRFHPPWLLTVIWGGGLDSGSTRNKAGAVSQLSHLSLCRKSLGCQNAFTQHPAPDLALAVAINHTTDQIQTPLSSKHYY